MTRLVDPPDAFPAGHPEFRIDHPLARRLDRHDDIVKLSQLLGGQCRTKIVIAGLNESQRTLA